MTIYRFQCKHFPGGQIGWEHILPNSNAPTKFVAVIALPSEAEHRTGAVVISDEFNVNEVSYGAIYVKMRGIAEDMLSEGKTAAVSHVTSSSAHMVVAGGKIVVLFGDASPGDVTNFCHNVADGCFDILHAVGL